MSGFTKKPLNILTLEKRLMLDASLPAIAGQVLWLDASDASTIIDGDGDNAATGTGGAGNGFSGAVATWQDKSGSGFNVSAAGTEQPTYGVNTQNGNGVITFDGNNDRLTSNSVVSGDDVTMFIVYDRTATTGRDAVFELGGGGSRNGVFLFANNTVQHYSSGTFRTLSGTYALNNYHLASYVHDGTQIDAWMNGDNVLSTTTTLRASTTGIAIGDDATGGDEMTGTVAEILVYDRNLTADERHDVETYLAGKWNLSITNADPTLDTNAGITLDEGTALAITNTTLAASDTDNANANLTYSITDAVDNGTLTNTNTALTLGLGDSFTQADIDSGFITYTHDGSATTLDSFVFDVSDGLGAVTNQTFNITVDPVGTLADLLGIANGVYHYDAQDLDSDGDTADQPADGTAVGTITNTIGTTASASESGGLRPLYDLDVFGYGRSGLTFDGANDRLIIPNDNLINTGSYNQKSFALAFRTGADISGTQVIYEQGGSSNGYNVTIVGGHLYAYAWAESHWSGADRFKAIDLGAVTADTTYTVTMVHDATGATIDDRTFAANVNGGAFTTLTRADVMGGHSGNNVIGAVGDSSQDPTNDGNLGAGSYFKGTFGEIWCWNHALDATEIGNVQDYLNDKWFDTAHTLETNTTLNVPEDAILSITSANLDTSDREAPDTAITYTITTLPTDGTLYANGIALALNDTFTQDDINNGLIVFDHDGTPSPSADSFDFSVDDGFNTAITGTFNFNIVAPIPTDPLLAANNILTLNEGGSVIIATANLDTNDGNTADTALTYTLTHTVSNGTLFRNGVALVLNDTFTQDDINNNLITYTHNDSEIHTDNFSFTVTDGTTTIPTTGFNFTITPVNDQTPTNMALSSTSVNENSSNGTVIGTLSATDADLPGDTFTYSVLADPDNKFQIVGNQLRVNGSLNREANTSHSVTIQVSDGVHTFNKVFNITVNDVNENPTDIALAGTSVAENSANGTVIGTLSATDPDLPGDTFTYSVFADPDNKFQIVGNQLQVNGSLDFEATNSHNVTIRVSDGNGGTRNEAFTITVTNVNDTPTIAVGTPSLSQGEVLTLTTAMLNATDQDNLDSGLIYEITTDSVSGALALSGTTLGLGDTFTQQDIINGSVTYAHDNATSIRNDSFSFTVTDGSATSAPSTLALTLDVSRDALGTPTINEGGNTAIQNTDLAYDVNWHDTDWAFRRTITVDSAQIDSDLTDYALLITEAGFDADFWSNVKADGSDIIIVDSAGNQLDRELVSINTALQTMQLYARTDLSSSVDTALTIYYGNAAATETNAATTWRNEFKGVWHFDDNFNDGDTQDSSQTNNVATAGNGFNNTNQVAGVTGNAADFNNSEFLALNYSYSGNNVLPEISVSAWVNTTVTGTAQNGNWAILDFDRSNFFDVYVHEDGRVGFSTTANGSGTNDFYSTGTTVNDGNWHHIAATYDGTDKVLYVDGVEVARDVNSHNGQDLGTGTRFGFIADGSEAGTFNSSRNNLYYDGLIDDLHFYEGTMDAAWIAAEYRNYNAPSTFYSASAHESRTQDTQYTMTDLPDNGTLYVDANTNGIRDAGEALALNDTFTQDDINTSKLRYEHNGGETTSDSFEFNVRDAEGNTTATQHFDITIAPVNDTPTDIILSSDHVAENSPTGTLIATLNTTDVDLPGDTFTYTILNDPDGKFVINGSNLELAGSVDFETAETHSVTLRTDDGNGGTFDRIFTINIDDLADDAVIPQPEAPRPPTGNNHVSTNGIGQGDERTTLKKLEGLGEHTNILQASLSGEVAALSAFYNSGEFSQILRENTTFNLRNERSEQEKEGTTKNVIGEQNEAPPETAQSDEQPHADMIKERFTNIRESLEFLVQMDNEENEHTDTATNKTKDASKDARSQGDLPQTALDRQFQDVLNYHKTRQDHLRSALIEA